MRGERDRFVALAFCWADILMELDSHETVVFAAGATQPVLGRPAEDLVGLSLPDLILERDRSLVQVLLGIARKHHLVDLGCEDGFWSYEFAREVGLEGRVYALDIEPGFPRCPMRFYALDTALSL